MKKLQHYAEIIDQRSLRERIYILLAFLVLLIAGWAQLFLEPSLAKRKTNLSEVSQVSTEIALLHAEETAALQAARVDPDLALRVQIAQLDLAIDKLDRKLEAKLVNLLSPRQMPILLQKLLKKQKALHLSKMENLPPRPMVTLAEDGIDVPLGIYIHGLNMEMEGSYLKLLSYLEDLEQMEQQVFWDVLSIDTQEFPLTKIRLQIHTLSLTEDWIGV